MADRESWDGDSRESLKWGKSLGSPGWLWLRVAWPSGWRPCVQYPTASWTWYVSLGKHGPAEVAGVISWSWRLRFGITGGGSNTEQSCGGEGWLSIVPAEQLALEEMVSAFPRENLGYFSHLAFYFGSGEGADCVPYSLIPGCWWRCGSLDTCIKAYFLHHFNANVSGIIHSGGVAVYGQIGTKTVGKQTLSRNCLNCLKNQI